MSSPSRANTVERSPPYIMSSFFVPTQDERSEQVSTFPKKDPELKSKSPILFPNFFNLVIPEESPLTSDKDKIGIKPKKKNVKPKITINDLVLIDKEELVESTITII